MLSRRSKRALRLQVGHRKLTFETLADLEFCLSSRTEVPAGKVAELVSLSPRALYREAARLREAEKRFVNVLAKSLEQPHNVRAHIRDLGARTFSQDHEWRTIISALVEQDDAFGDYMKIALVKYLQYLGSRQDVLKSLYASKAALGEPADPESTIVASEPHKETVIFDIPKDGEWRTDTSQFQRLPKGETVAVRFYEDLEMEVMLSRNRFKLVAGSSFALIDKRGTEYRLRAGRNVVGRDSGSEVVIEPVYRDVSRTHVVIEPYGEDKALITDLSSHGTYVPIRSLGAT